MDLDDDELKATRKLLGVDKCKFDKEDLTDYLINREDSIEYKINDIDADTMTEEVFNELIDNFEVVAHLTMYGRKGIKENVKKLQAKIKELEKELNNKENKIWQLKETIQDLENECISLHELIDEEM